jgi:hypothetical protein
VEVGEFVYYIGNPLIDIVRPITFPIGEEYVPHGGLQWAMTTALTGLAAAETTIDHDGLFTNSAPILMTLRFNGLSMGLASQDSVQPPVSTPEPTSLALVMFGPISLLASRQRRRWASLNHVARLPSLRF